MPVFFFSVIFQIAFAIHVIKTGRDTRWLYFIIIAPGVGCAVYFFVEILPGLFSSRAAQNANLKVKDFVAPNRNIKRTSIDVKISSNVQNIVAHAHECQAKGIFKEAEKLYKQALSGIYEYDPDIMQGLARVYFDAGKFIDCKNTLNLLIEKNPGFKSQEGHLLYARSLVKLGETDAAIAEYLILVDYYSGPEAKFEFGMLLKQDEKTDQANEIFQSIIDYAYNAPKFYKKKHKRIIEQAKKELVLLD